MSEFKLFLESEEEKNVKSTLLKLPKKHQNLINGYKIKFTPGNTLKGDSQHIGYIHKDKVVVAAPWKYGREFTFLHEIAHLVYEKLFTPELKKEWEKVAKKNPQQNQDNAEENFAMAYAGYYMGEHSPKLHSHPEWDSFIKNKVPN